MIDLLLPPAYRAVHLTGGRSAVAAALDAAVGSSEEGVLFWSDRADRLDSALLLKPDRSRHEMLPVIYVAALAFADALGSVAPPPAPISFRWPGGIVIDGGVAGYVSLYCAPSPADAVPAWAVLGFDLTLAPAGCEPGHTPDRTSISEEGFEDFSVAAQIEGFARHFLMRLRRWEEEGLAPVAAEWSRRALGLTIGSEIHLSDGRRGSAIGLDPAGNLRVLEGGRESILPLEAALIDHAGHG